MNVHARFSKCSPKNDPLVYLIVIQMEGWKLEYLQVEDHKPT